MVVNQLKVKMPFKVQVSTANLHPYTTCDALLSQGALQAEAASPVGDWKSGMRFECDAFPDPASWADVGVVAGAGAAAMVLVDAAAAYALRRAGAPVVEPHWRAAYVRPPVGTPRAERWAVGPTPDKLHFLIRHVLYKTRVS